MGAVKGREPAVLAVKEKDAGQRVDRFLKNAFDDVPYVGVQKLIRQGRVRVNGVKCKGDARVAAGDRVSFPPDMARLGRREKGSGAFQASEADVRMLEKATLYEDKWILVLNKPAGLPAQAGGGQVKSLDRILAAVYGAEKAPKLVHRLDRETTGLIICAKTRTVAAALGAQFSGRGVEKEYLALACGKVQGGKGKIEMPILKLGARAVVDAKGDAALTLWQKIGQAGAELFVLTCRPHTGRMNQIRVHCAWAGFPLVGDDKYGNAAVKAAGRALHKNGAVPLYLHAWRLRFEHPHSGEAMRMEAPLPPHFAALTGVDGRESIFANIRTSGE